MQISESMRSNYDVVGVKLPSGKIEVGHKKPAVSGVSGIYESREAFETKMGELGLSCAVVENVNG
jgi:hypothetical protein